MKRFFSLVIPMALGLAACTQQAVVSPAVAAETAPATHPVSGLEVIPVSITSHGAKHVFRAEVAKTAREQAQGLMFRTEMGKDEGMIFPRPYAQPASFWMKNTVIPLDIIYIGADHKILNIANAKPYSLDPIPSDGPALAVLELNGGRAAELGIKPGDEVSW
ncbi:DUF192 domain-containing protein [Altererythrobacter indicus]|uniref:DUF192 domain-containing protein n=2 Tax=Altericroceibacterium indicum TaxID=374177 RepID=A0A845ABK8_9SPHN|nr:DUF192 domain-containing protein [Altericroceibacterium indicum]MXP26165.1 DUF192 domain-containing protein [Altericroceibacterium indicum]